jgi:hypothetical protein
MGELVTNGKQSLSSFFFEQDTSLTRQLDKIHSNSKTSSKFNEDNQNFLTKILNYVNLDAENDLRDFLYSPAGIAAIIGLNATEIGIVATEILFSILLVYDIKKWINNGEPNWLYLITDILSIATAGFASSVGTAMIKAGKSTAFKSISQFFRWVKKLYPTIWTKFIIPLGKSIGSIIEKITVSLSKLKNNNSIPNVIVKYLGKTKEYLMTLKLLIEKNLEKFFGKVLTKTGIGYGKYKTKFELLKSLENTELGEKIIKKSLPYINPLLGSDKIDPFILDLIENPTKIDLSGYKILPIFKNNSLDSF